MQARNFHGIVLTASGQKKSCRKRNGPSDETAKTDVSLQVWHDKDPSLIKGHIGVEQEPKFSTMVTLISICLHIVRTQHNRRQTTL